MLRVAAARKMLEDGTPSIERVGLSVGYEDAGFFRRIFKRHCGVTPSAYHDRFRSGKAQCRDRIELQPSGKQPIDAS